MLTAAVISVVGAVVAAAGVWAAASAGLALLLGRTVRLRDDRDPR